LGMHACRQRYQALRFAASQGSHGVGPARLWQCWMPTASIEHDWRAEQRPVEGPFGLTFELTRVRKRAKPAVALRVQRRVRPIVGWCYRNSHSNNPAGTPTASTRIGNASRRRRIEPRMRNKRRPHSGQRWRTRRSWPNGLNTWAKQYGHTCALLIRSECRTGSMGSIGLTFELTRGRQMAKPAVALRVQRRVRPMAGH